MHQKNIEHLYVCIIQGTSNTAFRKANTNLCPLGA